MRSLCAVVIEISACAAWDNLVLMFGFANPQASFNGDVIPTLPEAGGLGRSCLILL